MLFVLVLLWVVIGAVIGFVVSKFVNLRGDAPIGGIGVSALSGGLAGLIWNLLSGHGLIGWTAWSCLWAAIGAAAGVTIWHLVRSRYVSRERGTVRRSYN